MYSLAFCRNLILCLEKGKLTPNLSRREHDDGDQIPLFASPQGNQPWMDQGSGDRAAYFSRSLSPESDALDATTLDAATDLLEGLIDDLSTTEASDMMREEESVDEDRKNGEEFVFNDLGEAASFNTARPPDPHQVRGLQMQTFYAGPSLNHRVFSRSELLLIPLGFMSLLAALPQVIEC